MERYLMIDTLFEIPIYHVQLKSDPTKVFNYIKKQNLPGRVVSNDGGYQSIDIQNKPTQLVDEILKHANIFGKKCNIKNNLIMDNMWLNINKHKNSNREHKHLGCVFSGAYYIKVPKNSGNIVFINPNVDIMDYAWHRSLFDNYNKFNSGLWNILPSVGELILFPSFLKHYVEPNLSKEERVSISFNINNE